MPTRIKKLIKKKTKKAKPNKPKSTDPNKLLIQKFSDRESRLELTDADKPLFSKLNGIDHICWINLDRSEQRRINMEHLFSFVDIPTTRVSAIDGNTNKFIPPIMSGKVLTKYEIACTLSHIKAISTLSTLPGEYFMVCEDDISFRYLPVQIDLKTIVKNAPIDFDIIQLHKSRATPLPTDSLYIEWFPVVPSAVCYVLSRKGINNVMSNVASYDSNTDTFTIHTPIAAADNYMYRLTKTYVYKYNYVATRCETSTLHPHHIPRHVNGELFQMNELLKNKR